MEVDRFCITQRGVMLTLFFHGLHYRQLMHFDLGPHFHRLSQREKTEMFHSMLFMEYRSLDDIYVYMRQMMHDVLLASDDEDEDITFQGPAIRVVC